MKTFLVFTGKLLLGLIALIALYVGISFLLARIPTRPKEAKGEKKHRLFIDSNGVHCDFVLSLEAVPADLKRQLSFAPSTRFLAFGWGDKGFYLETPTWAELKASVAIRAMLLPSPTAMHVTEHDGVGRDWRYVDITDEQLETCLDYIRGGFRINTKEEIAEIVGKGYTDRDRFYEGTSNYSALNTCNTWVNRGLRKMEVKTAVWTADDDGIMRYLTPVDATVTSFS